MKKILRLQSALLKEIDKYEKLVPERSHFIDWERVHITSCAKIGYMLAEERGVDPILAAAACAVHDYGRIITGKQPGHAEAGYLPVQEFLKNLDPKLFTEDEIAQIAIAVKNHSKKGTLIQRTRIYAAYPKFANINFRQFCRLNEAKLTEILLAG